MKLQKQLSRRLGDMEYSKWVLVIPPDKIQALQLKEGDELNIRVEGKRLIIEKQLEELRRFGII